MWWVTWVPFFKNSPVSGFLNWPATHISHRAVSWWPRWLTVPHDGSSAILLVAPSVHGNVDFAIVEIGTMHHTTTSVQSLLHGLGLPFEHYLLNDTCWKCSNDTMHDTMETSRCLGEGLAWGGHTISYDHQRSQDPRLVVRNVTRRIPVAVLDSQLTIWTTIHFQKKGSDVRKLLMFGIKACDAI